MSTEQEGNDHPEPGELTAPERDKLRGAPVRILIAKPGLDGHDRGAKVLVRALRDAGFEVVYTGLFQTPEMIASAALQEDVQVIGLSILSGAHTTLFPRIMEELRQRGLDDLLVIAGGTIPKADIPRIKALGVAEVFGPGTRLATIVDYIRDNAPEPSPLW
jgi:methylmalonyl-CoA mutase, C-terminal domain